MDQLSIFKSIAKWSATVSCVSEIAPVLRKAFQIAQSGVPGPVFVELPIDVLYPIQPVWYVTTSCFSSGSVSVCVLWLRWSVFGC